MIDPPTEQEVRDLIRLKVRGGFDTPDEVAEAVAEQFFELDERDADAVAEWVSAAFEDHLSEQVTWPAETDPDRLDATFATLQRQGVLVLQNAGTTQSDGLADAAQAYVEAGGEQSGIAGFCFYTSQDLDRAVDLGELTLSFGDADGSGPAAVAVGQRVRAALEADGFTVRWDGTLGQRIDVLNLDWRRRR